MFDPCRKNINVRDKDGTLKTGDWQYLKDFRRYSGSVRCFENLFGFSSQQDKYPGTIFRFPLRNRASDISNVLCSPSEVIEKLYKSLVEEAPYMLLFLKNISKISLCSYDAEQGCEKLWYKIMLDHSSMHTVQRGRKMCQERAKNWETRTDIFCHLNSLSVSFTNNLIKTLRREGTYHWLVMNCIAGKNCKELESLSKNLSVIPWAGVAAQLPVHIQLVNNCYVSLTGERFDISNINVSTLLDSLSRCKISVPWVLNEPLNLPGHAFCFLPLPSRIGLPVFVHGYFSVADNRRSIKWPSHDEHGEEALFNQALVENLVTPTYAFLLACRSSLITYKEMPLLYDNSHNMLEPYCIWPLLTQDGQASYSMWSTLVDPVIRLLVNHNLPVVWTSAGGGRKTSLLSALYLPGTFTTVNHNLPNVVIEVLTVLEKPLVILPIKVAQVITRVKDIRQKMFSREISPGMVRSILKEQGAHHTMSSILLDKQKCSTILGYVLSDISESSCHELQNIFLLPVEKTNEPPKPFVKQNGDWLYIVADKQCTSFLPGVTDQLIWSVLSYSVLQQLEKVVGYKQYQLKIADANIVCTELLPHSMSKWTNCNGGRVMWKPGIGLHPPLQWLQDVWSWLNKTPIDINSISNLSIVPLDLTASPINLIPLSFCRKCFLVSKDKSVPAFIPEFLKNLGFMIVCETSIVFAQSQIKEKFNPISPDSIIKGLASDTIPLSRVIESIKSQPHSDKTAFLRYIAKLTKSKLSNEEIQVVRQLPLFKPFGNNQFVSLYDREWILLTNGIRLQPSLQYPSNIFDYSSPEECRLLKLLGCPQPTFTQLCIHHVIPFALTCAVSNVNNTHNLMKWVLSYHIDMSLMEHLSSCNFVPRGRSGELVKPCDLFDPEDPQFSILFDQHEDCIPSDLYRAHLPVLRRLGLQTWTSVSRDQTKLNQFLIDRANSVYALSTKNYMKAVEKSVMIVHLLKSSNSMKALSEKLSIIPFLFCQNQRPGDYPKSLTWFGEGIKTPFPPCELYPVYYKLLIGSIGPVIHEWYSLESQILSGMLKTPYISELFSQLAALANTAHPSHEISKIVYSIYDCFTNENKGLLVANQGNLPPKWIWIETYCKFVSTSDCAVNSLDDLDLSPYYYSLSQINQLKGYLNMFLSLGVPQNFESSIVRRVLLDIKRNCYTLGLSETQLKTVLHILQWIHKHGKEDIKVLLPTDNMKLLPPEDCTYNDVHWDESKLRQQRGYSYVHPEVPPQRAKYFRVVPLSHRIAPSKRIGLKYIQRGPHQSVTGRLKEAIEEYGGDVDVFKELIQNADDAGATQVKFIIDWRHHPCDTLLESDLKHWQGPALLAYNNGVFNQNDLENICELAGGSKKSDPTKIGRFGIGFCSIYHLTDVPSFITGNHFIVFDPHTSYLGSRVTAGQPGMQINMKETYKNLNEFKDQFAPYCGLLGFDMTKAQNGYNSTFFRFPFRNYDTACKSKISTTMYDKSRVEVLCDTLKKAAPELLVFLQNVRELSLYELDANSSVNDLKCLLTVTKTVELAPHFGQSLIEQFRQGYSLESCQKKIFKVECCIGQMKQEDCWMVTSCLGSGKSKVISQSPTGKANGLCPLGEIATKLDNSSSFAHPLSAKGKLFCFLPLPIPCSLKFYCSGYFEVSKDRRWLKKDASSGKLNEWNSAIIRDALYNCFIKTLVNLTNVNLLSSANKSDKEKFLNGYYSLWPNANNISFVGRLLFHEIERSIHLTTNRILWSDVDGGTWLSPKEASVYNHHNKVKQDIRNDIIRLLLQYRYPIVDIPYDIKAIMSASIRVVDYKDFCSNVLIHNIATLPVDIRDSQIIALLLYIDSVPDPQWAKKLLKSTCCIPTRPNGRLRKPDDLIDPNSRLTQLYFESDECFPTEKYMEVANALRSLGMSYNQLTVDKLKARASSVMNLPYNEAIQRAKQILFYLSQTYTTFGYHGFDQTTNTYDALQNIPFIPVSKHPQGLSLPWFNSSVTFQSPKNVFSYKHKNLVFTQAPVVMLFDGEDQILIDGLRKLKVESLYPSTKTVITHLLCLVNHSQQNSFNLLDHELLNECCPVIYEFLQNATSQIQNDLIQALKLLKGLPFIWQNKNFLTVDQIKLDSAIVDAFPYLCELSDENKKYKDLFIKLGVTAKLGQSKLFSLLESVHRDHNGKALSGEYVRFVISIAAKLNPQSLNDHNRVLYLPDENGVMRPASNLAYKENVDLPALQGSEILTKHFKEGTFWLHHWFTADLARQLGIMSALNSIINEMSSKTFLAGTEYGQCEDLCDRLNSILRKYPHDESIFKEFIQNADDAGASEIVFILDHRNYTAQDGELFSSDPEWRMLRQCPSLLVYNNKKMSEDDIIGITKLGRGNKEFSPDLIGRFGIGFNVAYHVTDCAMFVSYGQGAKPENFCILDPGGLFVPGHHQAILRGRRFEMNSLTCHQFSTEFDPFYNSEVFLRMSKMCEGCFRDVTTNFHNGCVLFRLPFTRSINLPCDTKLRCGYKMDAGDMQRLFKVLSHNAENIVLFLNSIKSISAFEIQEDGTCLHHFTTVVSQSSKDATVCTEHAARLKVEVKNLKSKLDKEPSIVPSRLQASGASQSGNNGTSLDVGNVQYNSYPEVSWGYQLKVQTITHGNDTSSQKSSMHKASSVWFISQQFGSKQVPTDILKAAMADGLIPKGGVAVQVYTSALRATPLSLFCSLPLPLPSRMPVHINGNFWVDDSRKHLEFGASRSFLTDWNCYLTRTVIADAYINSLVSCKQFIPDKSTEWYYNIFPIESGSDSDGSNYPFGLYKIVYQKIVQKNLLLLQQDTLLLTGDVAWLPVVGRGHGYFFLTEEGQQILRQLLIEFGVKLSKAPPKIYSGINMAAVLCKQKYNALIGPVMYIDVLKSLNLQQHKETIVKNIIILLKYCLSTDEGCNAIKDAPLLLTYSGNLRQFSVVYRSKYAQLLPHKADEFIHPDVEKQDFIHKLILRGLYVSMPGVDFVSSNLQIQSYTEPVHVDKCLEVHSQIIELWKYLNDLFVSVKTKHVTNLNRFSNKPIIPAFNKTLVPICKAKMVLSPNDGGPVKRIMKLFGYPVLDFSILCESTFHNFTDALDKILTHCNNGNDILECIKLTNLSPVLPSSCNIAQYKEDIQIFLNLISTSMLLSNTTHSFLCKLPIFEAVTGDIISIKDLQNTYLIPDGVPSVGLKEVMMNSSVLILKHLPVYVKIYKVLKIQHCDVARFYLKAVIPFLQAMKTKDIIKHISFIFLPGNDTQQVLETLKASKFIYVADRNRWCYASQFYDPRVRLFGSFSADRFPRNKFPPQEWCTDSLLENLLSLGLRKDLSWQVLYDMVKDVEQEIKQDVTDAKVHQDIYCKSKQLLEFIHCKLPMIRGGNVSGDADVDRSVDDALQFCKDISQIVFVPTHEDDSSPKKEVLVKVRDTKQWTRFSTACFASHCNTTFLVRDIITASFSLTSVQHLYSVALGIEDPPSCETVVKDLLQLSQIAQSMIQSSKKQSNAIKHFLKQSFDHHYAYLDERATPEVLGLLQGKQCVFVEHLSYFVVSGDCIVKNLSEQLFPYLCRIPQDLAEKPKLISALKIYDEPNSCHYARILERIHHEFSINDKKLSDNSKYLELASKVCDNLVDTLCTEETNQSVPDSFSSTHLYLLNKQNELQKATELSYDDVPWYSKRLQGIGSYKYMRPFSQGRQDAVPLPRSLGVKLLSELVIEELDESVQLPDNHCADERCALQRGQPHGCQFVLSLENLLSSTEFKLGLQRIIYHQKHGADLTKREIGLTEILHKLEFSCYYKIVTVLKRKNGQVIQGSSSEVFSVLCKLSDQKLLLCLAPHCDDKDAVIKELAQNINRHLSCIIQNESHLEAMIKCPSHLDIEAALDRCKVKSYTAADRSVQKLPSVGESITPNITDLLIVLNYSKGERIKYWNENGKLILAKVVAVKPKLLADLTAKSLTVCTGEDNDVAKINTSPIFVSKYLQPSFLDNWLSSEKKVMDCSGLLLYHLENDHDPLIIQKRIMSSFKTLSHHQISIVFKRLFFHLHFYFVKCNKQPKIFNELSVRYFKEQISLFEPSVQLRLFNKWLDDNFEQIILLEQSLVSDEDELVELFEDMCIYFSSEPTSETDSDIRDEDVAANNPFENRDFLEQDWSTEEVPDKLCYRQQKQNIHYRKVHLQKAANISGATRSQLRQINANSQPASAQTTSSSATTFTNAFSQPVIHSAPTTGGLFRTSTGGYRSRRARQPRRPPVSVWNQDTAGEAPSTDAPPKTNFKTAFMWLQQAIADFNAAKYFIECTRVVTEQGDSSKVSRNSGEMDHPPCQFPALICFLSHEVVEKSLKAMYLAKCGSTLTNQRDLNLVALYDQLSTTRCWPLKDVKDSVLKVSDHNMRCRYPDSHVPPEAPCVLYTGLDARHALAAAQEVFVEACSVECFKEKLPSQPTTLPLLPSTVYLDPNSKCKSTI